MVTADAAKLAGMDDAIGRPAPGLSADIAIFDAASRSRHRAVIDAEARDVVLVLRGGRALYGDALLVAALPAGAGCDALDVCGTAKAPCATRDAGTTFAALESAVGAGAYPALGPASSSTRSTTTRSAPIAPSSSRSTTPPAPPSPSAPARSCS